MELEVPLSILGGWFLMMFVTHLLVGQHPGGRTLELVWLLVFLVFLPIAIVIWLAQLVTNPWWAIEAFAVYIFLLSGTICIWKQRRGLGAAMPYAGLMIFTLMFIIGTIDNV